jgi:hypothetical protein
MAPEARRSIVAVAGRVGTRPAIIQEGGELGVHDFAARAGDVQAGVATVAAGGHFGRSAAQRLHELGINWPCGIRIGQETAMFVAVAVLVAHDYGRAATRGFGQGMMMAAMSCAGWSESLISDALFALALRMRRYPYPPETDVVEGRWIGGVKRSWIQTIV